MIAADSLVSALGSLDVRAAIRASGPVWVLVEVDADPLEDGDSRVEIPVLVSAISQHGAVRWDWHPETPDVARLCFGTAIRKELEDQITQADAWLAQAAQPLAAK